MMFDLTFFAIAIPAVIFTGVSKGGFAGMAAFASTPILAMVLPPAQAAGLILPLLMMMDVATLRPYWGQWDRTAARVLLLGGLPGVAVGAALFRLTNPDAFRLFIGLIAVAFVVYQVALATGVLRIRPREVSLGAGLLAGLVAGFTSFVANAGGPPASVYMLARGVTKTEFQATMVIVFWIINVAKFVPFLFLNIFTWQIAKADLMLAPFAVFGAWRGVKAHHAIPERLFFGLTYVLLLGTGGKLIWDALT